MGKTGTRTQVCGAHIAGSTLGSVDGYAAADFFAAFGCDFTGTSGADFIAVFAFSLAANSSSTLKNGWCT
ncbi:MAG: hypothetical protein WBE76_10770 [Terracidiphilus sp.]